MMPTDVRAELIYEYMKAHLRKHFSRKDLANALGIEPEEITTAVWSAVRSKAKADGMIIPPAVGTGLYILTDTGADAVDPMMTAQALSASFSKMANEQAEFIEKNMKGMPRKQQEDLRAAINHIKDTAKAADSASKIGRRLYLSYEAERKSSARAAKAESEKKQAVKLTRQAVRVAKDLRDNAPGSD